MQFDKGYISPYFVTDADRMEAVIENPAILLVQGKISSVNFSLTPFYSELPPKIFSNILYRKVSLEQCQQYARDLDHKMFANIWTSFHFWITCSKINIRAEQDFQG
jgi:hypothetical protein